MAVEHENVEFLLNIWRSHRIRNIRLRRRLKGKQTKAQQKIKIKENNKTTKVNSKKKECSKQKRAHKIKWKLHGERKRERDIEKTWTWAMGRRVHTYKVWVRGIGAVGWE